jgi:tetratricopeptide (TPR) repeat protein
VALGFILAFKHQHDASIASIERALSLNPNYVDWRLGWPLVLAGHSRRAIDVLDAYMRLDPFHPPLSSFFQGVAHFMLEEYSQALTLLQDFISRVPQAAFGHLWRPTRDWDSSMKLALM